MPPAAFEDSVTDQDPPAFEIKHYLYKHREA